MRSATRTDDIADRLRSFFEADPQGAVAVYLFGSRARNVAGRESDVDLALLYPEAPPRQTLDSLPLALAADLEKLLGTSVDIVVLNTASPDLCHRVFRDGIILLDRDRPFRLRFELKKRNEYLDFVPVLRRYRRYPKTRVEK